MNNGNQIWQIPSTSLGKLRLHNSNMHVNMGSWAINTMNSPARAGKIIRCHYHKCPYR